MTAPIRILQVMGKLNRGGAESMIMDVYRNIDKQHIQFDFIEHTEEKCYFDEEIEKMGGHIYRMPKYCGYNHMEYIHKWEDFFLTHEEYKIVHCHIRSTAAIICAIADKYGVKTLAHSHSTSNGKGVASLIKKVFQWPLRYKADYFLACSKEAGQWLFGKSVVNQDNYLLIPNAINTCKFVFDESVRDVMRKELGIDSSAIVYGHVGRLHPSKNHLFLIDVFSEIKKKETNAKLVLVGEGDLRKTIEKRITDYGLDDSVIMLGMRSDVNCLMNVFDVFLFPSLWEGLPVTVVEAQTNGLPCLVSNTVTRDVNITKLVHNLPIAEGVNPWVNSALNISLNRADVLNEICEAGFDINRSVNVLSELYKKINEQCK